MAVDFDGHLACAEVGWIVGNDCERNHVVNPGRFILFPFVSNGINHHSP
jgi:hypothetical protein